MRKLFEGYIRITDDGNYESSLDGKEWESISEEEFDELKDTYTDLTGTTVEDEEEMIQNDLIFGNNVEDGKDILNKVFYVIYATKFPDGSKANPYKRAMFWTGTGGKIMDRRFAPKFSFWKAQAIMDNKLNKDSKYEWKMLEVDDYDEGLDIEERLDRAGFVVLEKLRTWDSTHYRVTLKEGIEKPNLEDVLDEYEDDTCRCCTCNIQDLPDSYSANIDILDRIEEDIEKHEELNPDLFDGEEMKEEVKAHLLKIVDKFKECLEADNVKLDINDVIVVGSNASYNYNKDSDIDLHIVAKAEESEDLYKIIYNAYKSLFNNKYDITIKGREVEVYVELNQPAVRSNGVYSLMNGWIKKPEANNIPDIDEEAFQKEFTVWEQKYNELVADVQNDVIDPVDDTEANKVIEEAKACREKAYRKYAGIADDVILTEEHMDDYWLNYVASDYDYNSDKLRSDLLNK